MIWGVDYVSRSLQEIFKTQLFLRNLLRSVLDLHPRGDSDETNQLIVAKMVAISRELSTCHLVTHSIFVVHVFAGSH